MCSGGGGMGGGSGGGGWEEGGGSGERGISRSCTSLLALAGFCPRWASFCSTSSIGSGRRRALGGEEEKGAMVGGVCGWRGGGEGEGEEGGGGMGESVAYDCLVQQFTVKEAHIRKAVPNDGRYISGLGVHRVPGFVLKVQDEVPLTQMKMIRVR